VLHKAHANTNDNGVHQSRVCQQLKPSVMKVFD